MEKIEEKKTSTENVATENVATENVATKKVATNSSATEKTNSKNTRDKKHVVSLTPDERDDLKKLTSRGKVSAREMKHAQILLLSDNNRPKGGQPDKQISSLLNVSLSTVKRVRRRFASEGLDSALKDKPRSGRPKFFSGPDAAHVTALACSDPPAGHARWSMRLLADKLVQLDYVETISHQTVSLILKKTTCRPT